MPPATRTHRSKIAKLFLPTRPSSPGGSRAPLAHDADKLASDSDIMIERDQLHVTAAVPAQMKMTVEVKIDT